MLLECLEWRNQTCCLVTRNRMLYINCRQMVHLQIQILYYFFFCYYMPFFMLIGLLYPFSCWTFGILNDALVLIWYLFTTGHVYVVQMVLAVEDKERKGTLTFSWAQVICVCLCSNWYLSNRWHSMMLCKYLCLDWNLCWHILFGTRYQHECLLIQTIQFKTIFFFIVLSHYLFYCYECNYIYTFFLIMHDRYRFVYLQHWEHIRKLRRASVL